MADHPPVPTPTLSENEAEQLLNGGKSDFTALMAKADHRFLAGDHRAAHSFYGAAIRLARNDPAPSGQTVSDTERAQAMVDLFMRLFREHLLASLDAAGFTETQRHPRFQKSLQMMLGDRERPPVFQRYPQTPLTYFYPDLPYVQFVDTSAFDWREELEAAYPVMRDEAAALLAGQVDFRPYIKASRERPQGDVHGLLENADWSTYFLWENGGPVEEHVANCPQTFSTVTKQVPLCHIGRRAPSVMLSLMRPGAHIPPHTGMINCRYICHLPLIVPENCVFRVGDTTIEWQEGKLIAFDDTVEHEAWNRSAENRIVLLFDVWRPELDEDERTMVTALFDAVDSYGSTAQER